jgi:hypothetical protein
VGIPLSLRALSKWVTLLFLIWESLGLIAALLKVALKIAYPHDVFGSALWTESALELTLKFAIVGLILSAYLRLRTTSQLPPLITRQSALLTTRAVQSILLATVSLSLLMAERTTGHADQVQISGAWTVSAFALGTVFVGVVSRKRVLSALNEMLMRDPNDANALRRWQGFVIQNMFLAMCIGLYGFLLRTIGNPRTVAWPFFVVSVALLVLWSPHLDGGISSPAYPLSNPRDVKS